jgi:hypothetical protein
MPRSHRTRTAGLVCAAILAACSDDEGTAPIGSVDATFERTEDGRRSDDDVKVEANADAGSDATFDDARDAADVMHDVSPISDVTSDTDSFDAFDAPEARDASSTDAPVGDAPSATDGRTTDASDTGDAGDASTIDSQHVHISISNTCVVGASPSQFTVPAGRTLRLSWHNHSVDYDADVWLSYGGGYLGLKTGDIWDDRFEFCAGPGSYMAYGDVSIAGGGGTVCPSFRVWIACQ